MDKPITRRTFLTGTAAAGIGMLSGWQGLQRACASSDDELRIGYLPITDAAPLLIAHALGYFTEERLKVGKPKRVRSWSTLLESFLTGKFNVTHMLLPMPIWMRYNNRSSAKVLAWDHTNGSALTVHGESGINGFEDLGGKQIAVPYWYSMHNILLQMGLKKVGITPVIQSHAAHLKSNETNLLLLPPPEMPLALSGKKIDGYIVAEPFNALGEMKIAAKIMRFTGDMWKNHPCCVIVMNEAVIQADPVFTQKVINAIVRAQLWITKNMKEAAMILSRDGENNYLPVPKEVLFRAFTGYDPADYGKGVTPQAIRHPDWKIGRIGFQPYPYPSATRFIFNEMRHTRMEGNTNFLKKLDADTVIKDLVDDRFVKKAINEVGGPGKFSAIDLKHPWERQEIIDI